MTTPRDVRLTPQQLALKLATAEAVHAAGGEVFVARECGRAQSRISDYCSQNTADFMPLGLVAKVETLGAGAPGHPHITAALARAQGGSFSGGADAGSQTGMDDLGDWLALVARENADVASVLAGENLAEGCDKLPPAARVRIGREAREMIATLEQLCRAIDGGGPTGAGPAEVTDISRRRADSS